MKILFINLKDIEGGAALAAYRLSKGLETFHRTENYFLVKQKDSGDSNVFPIIDISGETLREITKFFEYLLDRVLNRFGFQYYGFLYSTRSILKRVRELRPDIISLHVIHGGYFKTQLIRKLSKIAPIVWTLHDMWPFTANAAHTFGDESWKHMKSGREERYIYPHIGMDRGKALLKRKKRIYKKSHLHLVAPSHWLYDLAGQSPVFNGKPMHRITHGVDLEVFKPKDKIACRRALGIPENAKVIMFSSCDDLEDSPWKGGPLLKKILTAVDNGMEETVEALVLGKGKLTGIENLKYLKIHSLGYIGSERMITVLLGAADLFIYPSKADSLGLVLVEAIACGTPCITFAVGGCVDVIADGIGGYTIPAFDAESFAAQTIDLLKDKEKLNRLEKTGRAYAEEHFSLKKMADAYYRLFRQILNPKGESVQAG